MILNKSEMVKLAANMSMPVTAIDANFRYNRPFGMHKAHRTDFSTYNYFYTGLYGAAHRGLKMNHGRAGFGWGEAPGLIP